MIAHTEFTNIYKYADDGSITITHTDPKSCYNITQKMCEHLSEWCNKWRLKVNCDKNKTECLIIKPLNEKEGNTIPYTFPNLKINGKEINYVQKTKVLGLVVDEKLNFESHANEKIRQCWYTWHRITRNTTRFYGLNISSLVILFKCVVLTKLLYAAPVWMKHNLHRFNHFYSRVCLKISGATHFPAQNLTLLAMGLEPLSVLYDVLATKFSLKSLHSDTNMRGLMLQIEESKDHPFHHHIVLVKKYLNHHNCENTYTRGLELLSQMEESTTHYTKDDIDNFKNVLWKDFLIQANNEKIVDMLTLSSLSSINFNPTNHKQLFPRTASRKTDTKIMDLLHGHSLAFNSFRYTLKLIMEKSCNLCGVKDDNLHQLMDCVKFNSSYREPLMELNRESLSMSIILAANTNQVTCFRNMAQIIFDDN